MKICSISDLHGNLVQYPSDYWKELWECEVLFICGDILPLSIQFDISKSEKWLTTEFKPWCENLPVEKVFFIAGNHDTFMERNDKSMRAIFPKYEKVTYLKNEAVEYQSLQDRQTYRIFGSPYCHIFGDWPFMRESSRLKKAFDNIPKDVDILFTHDAPYGVSDVCFQGWSADGQHKGCPELREAILEKTPRLVCHGHLHSSSHEIELLGETKVVNCSILDEYYNINYNPFYIRL